MDRVNVAERSPRDHKLKIWIRGEMCLGHPISVIAITSVAHPSTESGNKVRAICGQVVLLAIVVREMIQLETVRAINIP